MPPLSRLLLCALLLTAPAARADTFSVLSFNAEVFNSGAATAAVISATDADIVGLQERQVCLFGCTGFDAGDAAGMPPPMLAAARGQVVTLRALLAAGASLTAADSGGATALHHGAWQGQAAAVQLLIENGASVTASYDKPSGRVTALIARASNRVSASIPARWALARLMSMAPASRSLP